MKTRLYKVDINNEYEFTLHYRDELVGNTYSVDTDTLDLTEVLSYGDIIAVTIAKFTYHTELLIGDILIDNEFSRCNECIFYCLSSCEGIECNKMRIITNHSYYSISLFLISYVRNKLLSDRYVLFVLSQNNIDDDLL